ncbi:MAG TPA: Ku protein [Candidatus Eisenbacteria bacterium]|nr:Ku protein [Candidatus Eisenbacteria bacterium]
MARSFWKGSLSFGLVEIPVRLQPATVSHDLAFTLLDRRNFAPVGNRRYNKNTGREIEWNDVVRGYEYEPDQYVVLSDEELEAVNVKSTGTIEILEFVPSDSIDSLYFETPYYIEPMKKASKSYALLRTALERTGRTGIARVVLRTRQRTAALVVRDSALVLNLLRYAHELRSTSDLELPEGKAVKASEAEVRMAERLIGEMYAEWDPDQFQDEYHDEVLALVEKKVRAGKTHEILEPEAAPKRPSARSDVVDLIPLLKRSLEERATAERKGTQGGGSRKRAAHDSVSRRPAARKLGRAKTPVRKKRTA